MSTRQQPLQLESAAAVGMLAYEEGIRPLVSKADRHERRVARRKPVPQVVEGQSEMLVQRLEYLYGYDVETSGQHSFPQDVFSQTGHLHPWQDEQAYEVEVVAPFYPNH